MGKTDSDHNNMKKGTAKTFYSIINDVVDVLENKNPELNRSQSTELAGKKRKSSDRADFIKVYGEYLTPKRQYTAKTTNGTSHYLERVKMSEQLMLDLHEDIHGLINNKESKRSNIYINVNTKK
jgi:hypothetical protein